MRSFRIKIPKIKKNKTYVSIPSKNAALSSDDLLTKSREMVMDDAYTFFSAVPVEQYDQAQRGNVDIGWTPKVSLRLFGTFPNRSGFNLIISKAEKTNSENAMRRIRVSESERRKFATAFKRDRSKLRQLHAHKRMLE